jgi:hypothetical protein
VPTLPLIALLDEVSDVDGEVVDDAAVPIGAKASDKAIVVPAK